MAIVNRASVVGCNPRAGSGQDTGSLGPPLSTRSQPSVLSVAGLPATSSVGIQTKHTELVSRSPTASPGYFLSASLRLVVSRFLRFLLPLQCPKPGSHGLLPSGWPLHHGVSAVLQQESAAHLLSLQWSAPNELGCSLLYLAFSWSMPSKVKGAWPPWPKERN